VKVALIGAGFVGQKRACALPPEHQLVACVDTQLSRADAVAALHPGCLATTEVESVVSRSDVDAVIVSTAHASLAPTALAAAQAGKHILVEKPGARSAAELRPLLTAIEQRGLIAKVGYNHRFHPAFQRAHAMFDAGEIGELLFIRARYGHGGRLGYEREWRADPRIAGGGELLDQGSHLIDLSRWFAGDFAEVSGYITTYFWAMPVEDNAFVLLKTAAGQAAWLHASWTEWKNLFSFEIFGRIGKLQIDGLGGSYGPERLTYFRMLPELGPPETTVWEFAGPDRSWHLEFEHFAECIHSRAQPNGSLRDAFAVLELVSRVYAEDGRDHLA
jgi:predicted dehydrogenase